MEWKTVKLGEIVSRKIGYGIVQPGASPSFGVPIIKANNIISGLSDVSLLDKTTENIAAQYSRTKLRGGELVISLVGSVGKTAIVPSSFAGANLVRATGLIDIVNSSLALWVKYYIDSPEGQYYINSKLNTTVQATLNVKDLVEMPIPMPDVDVRDYIVSILSSLDAQIENNNRINRNLEEQAQALFKSWFVDFEPWGGVMPDGWREGKLGEYCKFQRGVSYSSKDIEEGNYALLSMNNIRPYGGFIPDYSRKFSGKFKDIHLLQPQDLVIAITDITQERKIIGRAALMPDKPNLIYCTHLMRVESMMYSNLFLYGLFNYSGLGKYLAECSTGTTVLGLTADIITKIQWRFPNEEIASKYSDMVRPIFEEIFLHTEANARLAALRDTLLPKLMKGEIEV